VVRIIPFEESLSRDFRVLKRGWGRFLTLTKRLQLLRNNKARASRSTGRQRYLVQAEEYRFQAETFRDPTTQAQLLRMAAICEHWAMQADE
jgi:putative hemolysin